MVSSRDVSNSKINAETTIELQPEATDADRLLMESIMSEMPRSRIVSPRLASGGQQYLDPETELRSHSKNEEADRRDAFIASHEPSDQGIDVVRGSDWSSPQQLHRMESLESQASSEDSFGLNGEGEHNASTSVAHTMRIGEDEIVDATIPMDCVDDEDYDYTDDHFDGYEYEEDPDETQFDEGIDPQLTIDCSMISSGSGSGSSLQKNETSTGSRDSGALATSTLKGSVSSLPGVRKATRVAINGKTRLPIPKTNGSLVDKIRKPVIEAIRPRLPPKPTLLKGKHYPEEDAIENQTREEEVTIYVNAPIVEAEQERIYMNSLRQNQKQESFNGTPPTMKSAIVSPYNYQKPPFTGRSNGEMNTEKSVTPNPKQMLVTIV